MTTDKMLIAAVTALAAVVAYLFKLYVSHNKDARAAGEAMIKERESWNTERAKLAGDHRLELERVHASFELEQQEMQSSQETHLAELRAEYEKRFRELIERYDGIARRDSDVHRAHEDQVRKDFAEIMERVSAEAAKSAAALVQMLQKFYDRMVGPRGY